MIDVFSNIVTIITALGCTCIACLKLISSKEKYFLEEIEKGDHENETRINERIERENTVIFKRIDELRENSITKEKLKDIFYALKCVKCDGCNGKCLEEKLDLIYNMLSKENESKQSKT